MTVRSKDITSQPIAATALALSLPSAIFELESVLAFLLIVADIRGMFPVLWALFGLGMIGFAIWIARHGFEAALGLILGMFVALFIEARFRGADLRAGMLDYFEEPAASWFVPYLGCAALGAAIGLGLRLRYPPKAPLGGRHIVGGAVATLLVAISSAVVTLGRGAGNYSVFPPTRWISLAVLCFVLLATLAVLRRGNGT